MEMFPTDWSGRRPAAFLFRWVIGIGTAASLVIMARLQGVMGGYGIAAAAGATLILVLHPLLPQRIPAAVIPLLLELIVRSPWPAGVIPRSVPLRALR